MKTKILALIALIPLFAGAQTYHDRYEPVSKSKHLLKDFGLTGQVREVISEKLTRDSAGNYVPDQYGKKEILRFDNQGRLTEKIVLLRGDANSYSDTFSKDYYTYNAAGKLASVTPNEKYTYDDEGRLIEISTTGNNPKSRTFTYDEKGRLIVDECSRFKDAFDYDGDSENILTCTYNDTNLSFDLSGVITYRYWETGHIKSKTMKRNDRKHHFRDYIMTYYEDGKLAMISTGDTTNIEINSGRTSYFYNEQGFLKHTDSYNVYLGEGDALSKVDYTYEYDENGNWKNRHEVRVSIHSLTNKAKENWDQAERIKSKTARIVTYY